MDNLTKKNEIIIDLRESSNAREYNSGNIIHQREFFKVVDLIRNRITRATEYLNYDRNKKPKLRYNDAISILGSRGSGKTSFMLSILKQYENDNDIQVIPVIDPTLIEEKGHILLVIISLIQNCVQGKLKDCDCNPHSEMYNRRDEWKDLLRKLAAGLPTLDGVGGHGLNEPNWQDAEYVMDKGLKAVKSAYELEDNFNKILNLALIILNKKAFILALDDIDVDFQKGWPVLETLRKYLTSPQLIVLISGDLKLYSKAIRKQQWKSFGKALLKNEAENQNKTAEYNELVTEMEGQYLQKVLKPEYRIHLTTLFEKFKLYEHQIEIRIKTQNDELELRNKYVKILQNFGIFDKYQSDAYSSFLLSTPIRTQIQFLQSFNIDGVINPINIADTFLSDLYENIVNVELASTNPHFINIVILKLLISKRNLSEAYQLQPNTDDLSLNGSLTSLSFLLSTHLIANPELVFDYIIKIGYVRNLLSGIEYESKIEKPYSIIDLCQSSGLFQDNVSRDIVGNITAYIRACLNYPSESTSSRYAGIVPIYGLNNSARYKKIDGVRRLDEVFKPTSLEYAIASIPISISANIWKNSTELCSSIFMLLSSIGEIIRRDTLSIYSDYNSRVVLINKSLIELSQIRTYNMPGFNKKEIKGSMDFENESLEDKEINNDENGENILSKSSIANDIISWIDSYKNIRMRISPHLLGKITTRFFFGLHSIEEKSKVNQDLGEATYRRIIALINAIIVEEVKEIAPQVDVSKMPKSTKLFTELNLDNDVTGDRVFNKNISIADNYKEYIPLTRWIMSCPLLLVYLPTKEYDNLMKNYYGFISKYQIPYIKESKYKSIYHDSREINVRQKNINNNIDLQKSISGKKIEKKQEDDNKKISLPSFEPNVETVAILIAKKVPFKLFLNSYSKKVMKGGTIYKTCSKIFEPSNLTRQSVKSFVNFVNGYVGNDESILSWIQPQ